MIPQEKEYIQHMMEYKEIIENIFQTTPHFWDLYRYLENEGRVCYSTLLLHSVS